MIEYSYRRCSLAGEKRVIVSARMTFRKATPKDAEVLESYLLRRGTQPHGLRNAGCTFKNPEGSSPGKLLDDAGYVDKDGDGFREDPDGNTLDLRFVYYTGRPEQQIVVEATQASMATMRQRTR